MTLGLQDFNEYLRSVFAVLPVGLGDEINKEMFKEIALSIFNTGKFDDVKLGRDGNALLVDL